MELVILLAALPLTVWAVIATQQHHSLAVALPPALPVGMATALLSLARRLARLFPWLLVGAILFGFLLFFSRVPGSRNLFLMILLCRYALATGLFLVGLVPLALAVRPDLLANVLVLRRPAQLFNVAWGAVLVAAVALVGSALVEANVAARYPDVEPLGVPLGPFSLLRLVVLLVLALPLPWACWSCTLTATPGASRARWAVAGALGVVWGLILLFLSALLQESLLWRPPDAKPIFPFEEAALAAHDALGLPRNYPLAGADRALASFFGLLDREGYVSEHDPRWLAHGHSQLFLGLVVVMIFYGLGYLLVLRRGVPDARTTAWPAVFFVLVLLLLFGLLLQGVAFAFDRFRLPTSVIVIVFTFVLYRVAGADHYYDLSPAPSGPVSPAASTAPPAPVPTLDVVAANWDLPVAKRGRTLVLVTASGGGIQAAAWTSRVLVGLYQRYRDPLMRSIRLISAASGGSVGALFALDRWQPTGPTFLPEDLAFTADGLPLPDTICGRAVESSLEATAGGLAFPDLLRIVLPFAVGATEDRGGWIERAWGARLTAPDARLTDWSRPVLEGKMPIAVFNATLVETGQRLLAAPVLARRPGDAAPDATQARELLELYPGARPRVVTAARLSATFPFVSPICRPLRPDDAAWPEEAAYHVADGGYIDNEGMVTVVQWLTHLLDPNYLPPPRPFDRVLIVRIMPFPGLAGARPAALGRGWAYAVYGPIEALQNVRAASQEERNNLAVDFLARTARQAGVEVSSATFTFELPGGAAPPLSWMMTEPQKVEVERAWQVVLNRRGKGDPLATLDDLFESVSA
jgi:hypothetical protein